MNIQKIILASLMFNDAFSRKVLPFLKEEYFTDNSEKLVFTEIEAFITKYNTLPSYESLLLQVNEKSIPEELYKNSLELLGELNDNKNEKFNEDWLVEKAETYCQDKAIYLGVLESISILDGKNKTLDKGAIPEILTKALSVGFNHSIGHDYIEDYSDRYEYYHRVQERVPFDLEYFNRISNGGLPKKSISIIVAGTGGCKSLFKCHYAASCLLQGKNVLYITLELAQEEVAKRIDANLLNTTFDDLMRLTKEEYERKISRLKSKTTGKLVIKEYPTSSANATHFRTLLNELNLKRNFIPDIIFIDYLNICTSTRVKMSASVNSYTYVKSIAEEIRGLAVEYNVPILTSSQLNREGATSSDPNIDNISESFGTASTADFIFALVSNEELESLNQLMVKQIKNRYSDPTKNKRFVIGLDRSKMKLYDVEASAQSGIADSGQIIAKQDYPAKFEEMKKQFSGFKV